MSDNFNFLCRRGSRSIVGKAEWEIAGLGRTVGEQDGDALWG